MRTCSVEGCEKKYYGRDLCRMHWMRDRRRGSTDDPPPRGQSAEYLESIRPKRPPRVNDCGHPDRKHAGRGMCDSCYQVHWQRLHPDKGSKVWFENNPERARLLRRRAALKRHGITAECYHELWLAQGGRCANPGCDVEAPHEMTNYRAGGLQVDHDHQTGAVRGLLCGHCNRALGHVYDDCRRLAGLIEYLTLLN